MPRFGLHRFLPALQWLREYPRDSFADDLTAGIITAVLLIPQGMAYAILAGLPAEVGLYASIVPPIVYALFGTSRALSVGPVSVAALLVASTLGATGLTPDDPAYLQAALLLAALSGAILLIMALLRLGMLVNFLSHPVLSGFTTGAAILIIISQIQNLTGVPLPSAGSSLDMLAHAWRHGSEFHLLTAVMGLASILILLWLRGPFPRLLVHLGLSERAAVLISRAGPLALVAGATILVWALSLQQQGVAIVGSIPSGLPAPTLSFLDAQRAIDLLPAAVMISLIGYVESVSVAKVLAHRRRQKIDPNRELSALGFSNLAAAFSGSMPVAGGFSRSMVNFSAGARTQLAAIITALLVAVAAFLFTPLFHHLPKTALAAIIIVAVVPLIDWRTAVNTYRYDRSEALALLATVAGVLVLDIEQGLLIGLAVSIGVFLWRSSRPHTAIVGRVPGTQHFRNVQRHQVETWPELLLLRVDRSLYFANVSHVEDTVAEAVAQQPGLRHLVLICSAVNTIDHSALEALEQLAESLKEAGVTVHLAEVKGPVMDRLRQTRLFEHLEPGQVFLSTEEAVAKLTSRET